MLIWFLNGSTTGWVITRNGVPFPRMFRWEPGVPGGPQKLIFVCVKLYRPPTPVEKGQERWPQMPGHTFHLEPRAGAVRTGSGFLRGLFWLAGKTGQGAAVDGKVQTEGPVGSGRCRLPYRLWMHTQPCGHFTLWFPCAYAQKCSHRERGVMHCG